MNSAPVALFVYKRIEHTKKSINTLAANELAGSTDLFIFSDGGKSEPDWIHVNQVREFLKTVTGFKNVSIIEREKNLGLANSIIAGVNEVINVYKKVIVLEDDLISSPDFLVYMNNVLDYYQKHPHVFAVSGYGFPVKIRDEYKMDTYLLPGRASSWGWGTWKDRWEKIDWEITDKSNFLRNKETQNSFNYMGKDMSRMLVQQFKGEIDSWSIRFDYNMFKQAGYCVYPVKSRIFNSGMDGSGTHNPVTNIFDVEMSKGDKTNLVFADSPDNEIEKSAQHFFNYNLSLTNKVITKLKTFKKFLIK